MTGEEFCAWRKAMGWNRTECAAALGISRNMPQRYEDGWAEVPRTVELATRALSIKPFVQALEQTLTFARAIVGESPNDRKGVE